MRTSAGREFVFDVEGMTCESCVTTLEHVLRRLPEVTRATITLATRTASVQTVGPDPSVLMRAIENAGFEARLRDEAPERGT